MGVKDFCKHCCFWIQIAGTVFFCVLSLLVANDSYYLRSLEYQAKQTNMNVFCISALVLCWRALDLPCHGLVAGLLHTHHKGEGCKCEVGFCLSVAFKVILLMELLEANGNLLKKEKRNSMTSIHLYALTLSLIHICRCRRYAVCRSRWSPYH
eukprot:TRINITY_DN2056_c0_g2_i2.p1 TRINITY_DN2056_c0_g2~~TRINITY_DN2056_c0_g2_i2.p1  ORF type:complete len:153 (-),score=14.54 TRINITY_DN2056_c0_g2_i2:21-479(-)